MEDFSFRKGWGLLIAGHQPIVKERIMTALGISTRSAWNDRLKGKVEPRISEAQAIESIFTEFGVKPENVWGNDTKSGPNPA